MNSRGLTAFRRSLFVGLDCQRVSMMILVLISMVFGCLGPADSSFLGIASCCKGGSENSCKTGCSKESAGSASNAMCFP